MAHWPVQVRPGAALRTVVVKATFTLRAGELALAPTQRFPSGERYFDDDVERSLHHPDDLVPYKPCGECFVVGSFHAPGGRPVPFGKVAFKIGPVQKSLAVFGERRWGVLGPSDPAPTSRVPLRWEYAFGGPGVDRNPVGRGRDAVPQIEDPQDLLTSAAGSASPAGCAPIARTWAPRAALAGTYDQAWLDHLYPHYAADVDWSFFCAAPIDQRIDGFWRGDESLVLIGLCAERGRIEARLPGLTPRVGWVFGDNGAVRELREVPLVLDTLTVDADAMEVLALWRGTTAEPGEGCTHVVAIEQASGARASLTAAASGLLRAEAVAGADPPPAEPVASTPSPPPRADAPRVRHRSAGGPPPMGEAISGGRAPSTPAAVATSAALSTVASTPPAAAPPLDRASLAALERRAEEARTRRLRSRAGRIEVAEAARRGKSLAGRDLSELDLGGLQLHGLDLRDVDLSGAQLGGVFLASVSLDGARLDGAELSGARFVDTSMAEASLVKAGGRDVVFEGVNLRDALLDEAELPGARFVRIRADGVSLHAARLAGASFEGCELPRVRAGAAHLDGSTFARCRLGDAHLAEGCELRAVRMHECDLRGLRAFASDATRLFVSNSHAERARFSGSVLVEASFDGVHLGRADFTEAVLDRARFSRSTLRGARLDRASLVEAALPQADLLGARLEAADLSGADLRAANLFQAELLDARLDGALLELTNLLGTRRAAP